MIENDWDSDERREQERLSLEVILNAYQYQDDDIEHDDGLILLGHIVDISKGGVMLLSETPIKPNQTFKLLLEIGLPGESIEKVIVTAKSVWHRKDPNPGWFNSGFQFTELSADAEASINHLIDMLSSL